MKNVQEFKKVQIIKKVQEVRKYPAVNEALSILAEFYLEGAEAKPLDEYQGAYHQALDALSDLVNDICAPAPA